MKKFGKQAGGWLTVLMGWMMSSAGLGLAAQTTGGVNWLDPLGYQKPQFYPVTVPDEGSVANKYFVDQAAGAGNACTEVSPCGWDGLAGKPGIAGGPAYVYLRGNARLNLTGSLYGAAGSEIVIKPWPGSTVVVTMTSQAQSGLVNANIVQGANVHHLLIDGGPDLLFEFSGGSSGGDQNNYALVLSANFITVARTRIHAGPAPGPALGIGTGSGTYNDIRWINNEMYDSTHFYGVYTGGGTGCSAGDTAHSEVYFLNNIFRDICGRGIQIEPRNYASGTYVEGNAFHDVGGGCANLPQVSDAVQPAESCGGDIRDTFIRNNLMFRLGGGGVGLIGTFSNILVQANTIFDYANSSAYGYSISSHGISCYGDGCPGTVQNNIILDNSGSGMNPINRGSGLTTAANLCESGAACGADSKSGTPAGVFSSVDVNNQAFLKLTGTSPAMDAGVDLSVAGVFLDYLRTSRPQGMGYDIGAYEYCTLGNCGGGTAGAPTSPRKLRVR